MATERQPLLELRKVSAGYGAARVLHELDLQVDRGETLVIIGRNGVGKSTLVETIVGLTSFQSGEIWFAGQRIDALPAHARSALGVGWVPQEREVFRSLSVEENLRVVARPGPWGQAEVLELFPRLGERLRHLGGQLSGGEQQMLAMARALMTDPKLILLDEPTAGLSPLLVDEVFTRVRELAAQGVAVVMVEQNAKGALRRSDRAYVLAEGRNRIEGEAAALLVDPEVSAAFLGGHRKAAA